MNKRDLKIEVRAVLNIEGSSDRVLEYRISPDQDVSYDIEAVGWLERLEKRLFPKKYVGCYSTYHFVSKAYLQRYIDEAVYRFNTKELKESARFGYMFKKALGTCYYKDVKMVA